MRLLKRLALLTLALLVPLVAITSITTAPTLHAQKGGKQMPAKNPNPADSIISKYEKGDLKVAPHFPMHAGARVGD